MAWYCKECDDWFIFGYSKKYCSEECYDDKQERKYEKKERRAKKRHREIELENIKNNIAEYKNDKIKQIKNKHNIVIDYISDKVKVVSRSARFKNKITSLKLEGNEINKSLKELESFKLNKYIP